MYNPYHLVGRVPNTATTFKKSLFASNRCRVKQEFGLSSMCLGKEISASRMLKNYYEKYTWDTAFIFRAVNHFSPKLTMYNQCPPSYFFFWIVYLRI